MMSKSTERWVLTATILASSMGFIDSTALNVALSSIQASLHATGAQLLWVVNGYLLMLASLILVGGSLGDRWGRKKIFMFGISLFVLASMACGVSPSIQFMIAARIIQGIGGSFMIPGSLSIITSMVAPDRRGKAIGTWSAVSTLVTVAGPVLGGFLADHGLWRAVFLINAPLGIISLIVLFLKVTETHDETITGPVDVLGAALVTIGLAGLTYGFISAPGDGFQDPRVYITLLIGVIALIAFVYVETHTEKPMMPLLLFKSHTFSGTNLLTLFLYGGLSAGTFFLSLNLIQVQGYTKTEAGFSFLPFALLLVLMSRWSGGLADRRGPRLLLILGPSLAGCGFFWMAFSGLTNGPSSYWYTFLPGIALFGIGMGLTVAPLTTAVMGAVPRDHSGIASGINNAVSRTAGVLAIAIIGSVALFSFTSSLKVRTATISLSDQARSALNVEAQKLAGASVPANVGAENIQSVGLSIKLAFVDTFKLVMIICAALAWVSAAAAAILVEPRLQIESNLPKRLSSEEECCA
ncbi:MAG TPA: MFS transporter [Anaerolineaceae bacterium]|nr:MFS transporter [Anaerolineaceae bacterium]